MVNFFNQSVAGESPSSGFTSVTAGVAGDTACSGVTGVAGVAGDRIVSGLYVTSLQVKSLQHSSL